MTTIIGRKVNLGLARETSRGTAEASATFWIPKIDFDFNSVADYAIDESGLGVIDARSDAKVVGQRGEGGFGGIINANSIGLILAACLGTWSTSADDPETDVHTHTFTRLNTNQHPSLTIFQDDGNIDEKHALGMLNQLTLNFALKDYVRFNSGFMSKIGTSTSSTPSYSADKSFLAQHVAVKFAATIAALGTASEVELRAANLVPNKNTEDWPVLGSTDPSDIVNKSFGVSGDLEAIFDDTTFRDYVLDGDKKACLITVENTDQTIGTTSNPKLEITLAPMSFRDWGRGTGQDDVVTQTMAFDGNFNLSDAKTMSIELVNTVTSY